MGQDQTQAMSFARRVERWIGIALVFGVLLAAIFDGLMIRDWMAVIRWEEQMRRAPHTRPVMVPQADPSVPHMAAYPPMALREEQEGTVTLDLTIAPDGSVSDARVIKSSGYPQLDAAALIGVGSWRYKPQFKGGQAVAYHWRVAVKFKLQD